MPHVCGGQRRTLRYLFSLDKLWDPGTKVRLWAEPSAIWQTTIYIYGNIYIYIYPLSVSITAPRNYVWFWLCISEMPTSSKSLALEVWKQPWEFLKSEWDLYDDTQFSGNKLKRWKERSLSTNMRVVPLFSGWGMPLDVCVLYPYHGRALYNTDPRIDPILRGNAIFISKYFKLCGKKVGWNTKYKYTL